MKVKTNIIFFIPPQISLLNYANTAVNDDLCLLTDGKSNTGFPHVLIFDTLSVTSDWSVWESQKREKYLQNNYFVEI